MYYVPVFKITFPHKSIGRVELKTIISVSTSMCCGGILQDDMIFLAKHFTGKKILTGNTLLFIPVFKLHSIHIDLYYIIK